ncbi:hypothetical protein OAG71_03960 [bacterium]|nr:hypothetical protein [bacterium]
MNNQLYREPAELLEVVRQNYKSEFKSGVHAAFPVVLRQSLETLLLRYVKLAGIVLVVVFLAFLVTGSKPISVLAGIVASIVSVILTGSKITAGIVAVTDVEFALIELGNKASFGSGKIIEKIDIVSNPLPKPRSYKGNMDSDALPFKEDNDRGWYYAGFNDRGTGYMTLLGKLRAFQNSST